MPTKKTYVTRLPATPVTEAQLLFMAALSGVRGQPMIQTVRQAIDFYREHFDDAQAGEREAVQAKLDDAVNQVFDKEYRKVQKQESA